MQLAAYPHRLLAQFWKTSDVCQSDFSKTSERMLAELGFELTTPRLTARVATDLTAGARLQHDEGENTYLV